MHFRFLIKNQLPVHLLVSLLPLTLPAQAALDARTRLRTANTLPAAELSREADIARYPARDDETRRSGSHEWRASHLSPCGTSKDL